MAPLAQRRPWPPAVEPSAEIAFTQLETISKNPLRWVRAARLRMKTCLDESTAPPISRRIERRK